MKLPEYSVAIALMAGIVLLIVGAEMKNRFPGLLGMLLMAGGIYASVRLKLG